MTSRIRVKFSYIIILALTLIFSCTIWCTHAAWAGDEDALVAGSSFPFAEAEGQGDVLANSWRFENGVLIRNEGSNALSPQSEMTIQSINKSHFGVDVSEWDYSIDWSKTASAVEFAIVRCGYGDDYASQDDKYWLTNAKGCQNAGIPMGVYLYSYATNTEMARSEALHVVRCMKDAGLDASSLSFPIYLDMEDNSTLGSDLTAIFNTFRSTLAAYGYSEVGLYASCDWWRNRLNAIQIDANYRWIAHWGVDDLFSGYEDLRASGYGVWQYSDASSVAGIPVAADGNYMNESAPFLNGSANDGAMYRLYNPYSGEHLYTSSAAEKNVLSSIGWNYEGIGWHAPATSSTPVFRLYNPYSGDHHYTTNAEERDVLSSIGWNYEGVGWYSADSHQSALYRLYNRWLTVGTHHYTTSIDERDALVKLGWAYEGIAWYGLS